jgi:hypothetical protein
VSVLSTRARIQTIIELERIYGPDCFYCDAIFTERLSRNRTLDHYIPKHEDGTDDIDNLRLACYACNQAKGIMHGDKFLVSEWLDNRKIVVLESRLKKLGIRPNGEGFWHNSKNIHRVSRVGSAVKLKCDACGTISDQKNQLKDFPCQTFNSMVC